MRTFTAMYAGVGPPYVAVKVQVTAMPFGRRLLTGQFAMALAVSVTVPAASELPPLALDALNGPEEPVTPREIRERAADAARPVTASGQDLFAGRAAWRTLGS